MTKSNSTSFCPSPWALKGWGCFSDSQKDTKILFQACWGITIQRKRFWSHWGSTGLLFPSFPLLPLRLFHCYIIREEQPVGSAQTVLVPQQSLQHAASETSLHQTHLLSCMDFCLKWRVYSKKGALGVCHGVVQSWFCSTRWESLLWMYYCSRVAAWVFVPASILK